MPTLLATILFKEVIEILLIQQSIENECYSHIQLERSFNRLQTG